MKVTDRRFKVGRGRPGTGLGLYAAEDIAKGDFLLEYKGSKIPSKEADDLPSRYLFEINSRWTLDGPPSINTAGYINHSCSPNVEAEIEKGRVNIYAVRAIKKGEELTIDYGKEYYDEFIKPFGCKCAASKHH